MRKIKDPEERCNRKETRVVLPLFDFYKPTISTAVSFFEQEQLTK